MVLENSNGSVLTAIILYNCLSPSDCEDLVCLYLYDKANYIAIPSTNKIATELYECVS